jgi:Methyltransferase domain
MVEMILTSVDFLKDVADNSQPASLKSYSDTLLYYYLGQLTINATGCNVSEIGVGGSTIPIAELAKRNNKMFYAVDNDQEKLNQYCTQYTTQVCKPSEQLTPGELGTLGYIHLDGSKNYSIAKQDLEFAVSSLHPMGLICQDDYGNNRVPTIGNLIHDTIKLHDLKMLLVGDSSVWLVKKTAYDTWVEILDKDTEFKLLSKFININHSTILDDPQSYLFMNSRTHDFDIHIGLKPIADTTTLNYFNYLWQQNSDRYLQMPYTFSSQVGSRYILSNDIKKDFHKPMTRVVNLWDSIRGEDWPKKPPTSMEEIAKLPDSIKNELIYFLGEQ